MLAESLNIQPPSLYNHISGQWFTPWINALWPEKHGRADGGGRGRHQRICSMGGAPRRVLCLCPPGVFSAMLWYSKYQDHETMMVTGQLRVLLKAADCRHEGSGGQIALDKRIYYQTEKAPQDLSQSCGAFSMRNSGAEIIWTHKRYFFILVHLIVLSVLHGCFLLSVPRASPTI